MTYDGLDRLTDATSPMYGASGAHYTYDVLDNVTRIIAPGRDQAYCYDVSWRLTNVKVSGDCSTGSTILGTGFDVQGNLANWNGVAYTFDYGNRLRAIAGLEAYRYDAWGRRTRSSSTAGLVESLYGRDGQLLYQRDARTSRRRQYIYLAGSLVAEHDRPLSGSTVTVTYQHTDALGTPVATTDAARTVLQRSEYEPYGKLLNRPLEDGPAYTGHVSDAATSLVYMQQRYFDPRTARFWSVDPVTVDSAGGNFNRYWYANNNPYKFTDPDGRFVDTFLDIAFIASDINDIRKDSLGWVNGAALASDILGAMTPGVTGLGVGVKGLAAAATMVRRIDKTDDGARIVANLAKQTDGALAKAEKSLAGNVLEHQQKLEAFKKNPAAFDNKGALANAATDKMRQAIIAGGVKALEGQIRKNEGELKKVRDEISRRKAATE